MNIPVRCKIFDNNMMGDQLLMSALGQKRTFAVQNGMSALPSKADMCRSVQSHPRYKLFSRQYPFSSVDIRRGFQCALIRETMLEGRLLSRLHLGPINFSLLPGECVSVAGKSGAGKSVLLRIVADLDPHEGDALLDGAACSGMPAPKWRRMVTYVAAESGWWDEGVAAHFSPVTDFASLFPTVGIPAEASAWPVARLSTGERQRLALLRALGPENRVLLLDEPTSGLDAENTGLVEALLRGRLSLGTAILLVTHDPEQATRMASRHLEVRGGQLVEETR